MAGFASKGSPTANPLGGRTASTFRLKGSGGPGSLAREALFRLYRHPGVSSPSSTLFLPDCPRLFLPLIFLALTATLLNPASIDGQEDRFSDQVSVIFVEVPVQVIRRGKAVADLTAEDFIVLDEGSERSITTFEVIEVTTSPSAPSNETEIEAGEADTETTASGTAGRNRHMVLFFDFAYSRGRYMDRALRAAREMMEQQLHPTDAVAIATYGMGRGVELLDGFATDRTTTALALDVISARLARKPAESARLEEALRLAQSGGVPSQASQPGLDTLFRRLGPGAAAAFSGALSGGNRLPSGLSATADRFEDEGASTGIFALPTQAGTDLAFEPELSRIRRFGQDLAEFVTLLRHIPDPKHILMMSEGIPSVFFRNPALSGRVTNRLEPAMRAFVESGWVLHGMDVGGIPESLEAGFTADSLLYFADRTGGEVFENFNNLGKATDLMLERSRVSYLIGFNALDVPRDGSFHSLKVKLRDKPRGTKLLHRPGYYAPRPPSEESRLERSLDLAELVLEGQPASEFDATITPLLPQLADNGLMPVLFFVEIPGESLLESLKDQPIASLPSEEEEVPAGTLELQVHGYLLDPEGGVHDLAIDQLRVQPERIRSRLKLGGLRFGGRLEALPGTYELRVLVHRTDRLDNVLASFPVEIEASKPTQLAMATPQFFEADPGWIWLKGSRRTQESQLQKLEARQLAPVAHPEVKAGRRLTLLIPTDLASGTGPRLESWVEDANGVRLSPTLELLERSEGPSGRTLGLLAQLETHSLAPGTHKLFVQLSNAGEDLPASRQVEFTILQ